MIAALAFALFTAQAPAVVVTPEQTLQTRVPSDIRISPDGRRIAFVITEPPKGATRPRDIWLLDVVTRELRRLTYSPKTAGSPRWSPDGRTLAFLSDRDGGQQIYLLSMSGGEPEKLTEGKNSVQALEWSPDGKQIAFLAPEPRSDADDQRVKDQDDARVVDKDDRHPRVWLVEVASRKVRQLTSAPWHVTDVKWMPAGDWLVFVADDRPASDQFTDQICRVSVADGVVSPVAAPKGPFGQIAISRDGTEIAYVGSRVDGPSAHDLYLRPIGGPAPKNLTASSLDRPVASFFWRVDGSFVAVVQDGFKSGFRVVGRDGMVRSLFDVPVNPGAFASAPSGLVAFVGESTTEMPELWLAPPGGTPERVTRINDPGSRPPAIPREFLRYKSFDGVEIEGSIVLPMSRTQGAKLPLIVLVHGGPTGRWADTYEAWGQLLAARGYAIFYANVRGSTGYGQRFIEMNRADWGGGDFKDVCAGVDYLIGRGIADPDRLGIGGWSYGGYMAAWAVTQTNRFKAAVSGAPMSDLASEFGTEDNSAGDEWAYGLPYENLDRFIKSSPMTYVKQARTPTLLLQGEDDPVDPIGQSQQFYRGLKRYGVDVELVVYPREPHGFQEERHRLDMLTRILGWFDNHLMQGR